MQQSAKDAMQSEIEELEREIHLQQQLLTENRGEGLPTEDLKKWFEFDKIVRREEQRKVALKVQDKAKYSFEFEP